MVNINSPLLRIVSRQASLSTSKISPRHAILSPRPTYLPHPSQQAPTIASIASISFPRVPNPLTPTITSSLRQCNTPPPATSPPSSFFTPSLCRVRIAPSCRAYSTSGPPSTLTLTAPFSTTTTRLFPTSTAQSTSGPQPLTWNAFFTLRTRQRRYTLISSALFAVFTTLSGLTLLTTTPLPDTISTISSLDPILTSGLCTILSFTIGWLIGPFFGQFLWRLMNRGALGSYVEKEKDFFRRVRRYRVDPSGASTTNPVPDYYGEKVGSVGGYRRWLKDQRAFNRKKSGGALK
ncbi:MAG: hypothetical protein Q9227_002115 [Pyrenula ochraceoflavens]